MGLRIVTDSTADLPPELRKEWEIEMVPLTVHFGSESYRDQVDMMPDEFWVKLKASPHHPRTAQPAPGDFLEVYRRLHAAGHEILSLHLSGNLSGTINSAQIAAQMLPEAKITTFDTKSVSLGLGLVVLEAARMARAGKTAEEILAWARPVCDRMNILFTLDTLEFLQKNGRIGKAQALLGGLLGIKPILQVDSEGTVAPADKVRGKSKIIPRTLELMQERIPAGRTIRAAILHAQVPHEAEEWVNAVRGLYQVQELVVNDIGPIIASNAGPGTVGVVFYEV